MMGKNSMTKLILTKMKVVIIMRIILIQKVRIKYKSQKKKNHKY